jgi:hypothetical protein
MSTDIGWRLHAMAMLHAPKVGMETMERIIALSAAAFASNIGIAPEYLVNVVGMYLSAAYLKTLLITLASEVVLLMSENMKGKEKSLLCDKGEDKGNNMASFVKLLSYYDNIKKKVVVICFGIETAGNKSNDAAQSIDHALKLFEYYSDEKKLTFWAQTTDAGGGGVAKPLYDNLVLVKRAKADMNYYYPTCTLHAMNLMLSVPCENIMGTGRLKKRTFLQVLHTAYSLKRLFPIKVWIDLWEVSTGVKWVDAKCPVLSRWEHVGEATSHLKTHKGNWLTVCSYIIGMNNVGTSKNDVASYLYSYLNEKMLWSQILFVNGYITEFYDTHFQWMKHVDDKTGTAGYLAP